MMSARATVAAASAPASAIAEQMRRKGADRRIFFGRDTFETGMAGSLGEK
jgi:hypothetical protein